MNYMKTRSGFTLMEILIVAGLTSGIAFMASVTFFNIIRGSIKTEIVKEVRQNGEFAMSIMERMIRNSSDITSTCDGSSDSSISITTIGGDAVTFSCIEADGVARIASASATTGFLTNNTVTLGTTCPGSLSFTCADPVGAPKIVTIDYSLRQKSPDVPKSEQSTIDFTTTIGLRSR